MNRYAVRVMQPTGAYPTEPLGFAGWAALAADDVAWSVVLDPSETEGDLEQGELYWLRPSEVRFLAAASLAEAHPRTYGRIRVHSGPLLGLLELGNDHAADPDRFLSAARAFIHEHLASVDRYRLPEGEERQWRMVAKDYDDETERLLDAIDFADPLLHRGLAKFLTSTQLIEHPEFLEEAGLAAFISREAALELLRRKLSMRDSKRAKRHDVLEWIESEFPTGTPFVKVLQSDWKARVLMVHPVSGYGEFWTPRVYAEECFDALHTLTYLYRFLLLDEPWVPGEHD